MAGFVATATTEIDAPPDVVWRTLTDPAAIKEFMFGAAVETDWRPGSSIVWKGDYNGKAYEDKGEILAVEPGRRLELTHFSPLSGQADVPENYHTIIEPRPRISLAVTLVMDLKPIVMMSGHTGGLACLKLQGSDNVQFPDLGDLPAGRQGSGQAWERAGSSAAPPPGRRRP